MTAHMYLNKNKKPKNKFQTKQNKFNYMKQL